MKNKFKILVPVIIIILLSLIGLGCGSSNKTSNQIDDLLKYKGSYVGDNSAVGNIIAMLPANVYNAGFSLQTNKEPYEITINYKANKNLGEENYNNFWNSKKPNEFLEKDAVVLLSLIPNADIVEFNVDNVGEKSYKYARKDLVQKYGGDLKDLFKDKTSFKNFLYNN